jgi:uroporphyrin-III C-methyltransferase
MCAMGKAVVYLVGSGPGPVDLLTLRAAKVIANADVIIHDALVSADVLALAEYAQLLSVGKRAGRISARQSHINTQLVECALRAQPLGQTVVRLKGGDPLIFGRAEEEIAALSNAGIEFEVVSGLTAAQAAHASLRAPMTRRGQQRSFVLATPQVQQGDLIGTQWARPLVAAGCGAIYMAASASSRIKGCLLALGMAASTPITWVSQAGATDVAEPESYCTQTLETLTPPTFSNPQAPVILLIGTEPYRTSWKSTLTSISSALLQPEPLLV